MPPGRSPTDNAPELSQPRKLGLRSTKALASRTSASTQCWSRPDGYRATFLPPSTPAAEGTEMRTLLVLLLAVSATSVQAQEDVAQFYRNKTLTIVVGHESGTGYDFFGRALAR